MKSRYGKNEYLEHTGIVRNICLVLLLFCAAFFPVGCATESSPTQSVSTRPTITSLSPASTLLGSAGFTLTVNGTNYNNSSIIRWNGSSRTTSYVSSTQLRTAIGAADISEAGTITVTVRNTTPSLETSSGFAFTIGNLEPTITSINPSSIPANSSSFTLTIFGTNFVNGSSVQWGGSTIAADYISDTQLTAVIDASRITSAGTVDIRVNNPAPGGGTSNSVTFSIRSEGLYILTDTLPDGHNSKEYAYTLQAEGGVPPYTWTIQSGSLPAGLSLASNGEISGNPPAVGVDTEYPFSVSLIDTGLLTSNTKALSIRIRSNGLGRNDACGPDASPISNGVIRASLSPYGDVDVYSFQGTEGNTITIETFAQRITLYGNPGEQDNYMDSFLEILDSGCNTLQYNDDIDLGVVYDSIIAGYELSSTGTYYIRISDLRGDGRPDFIYELHLSGAD